jgi:hypothetical protein
MIAVGATLSTLLTAPPATAATSHPVDALALRDLEVAFSTAVEVDWVAVGGRMQTVCRTPADKKAEAIVAEHDVRRMATRLKFDSEHGGRHRRSSYVTTPAHTSIKLHRTTRNALKMHHVRDAPRWIRSADHGTYVDYLDLSSILLPSMPQFDSWDDFFSTDWFRVLDVTTVGQITTYDGKFSTYTAFDPYQTTRLTATVRSGKLTEWSTSPKPYPGEGRRTCVSTVDSRVTHVKIPPFDNTRKRAVLRELRTGYTAAAIADEINAAPQARRARALYGKYRNLVRRQAEGDASWKFTVARCKHGFTITRKAPDGGRAIRWKIVLRDGTAHAAPTPS